MRRAAGRGLGGWAFASLAFGMALLAHGHALGGAAPGHLRVFAPWCMEKRLRRVVEVFQETCPTTPVRFTTGTPGKLIGKVKAGALPDVYIAMGPPEVAALDRLGVTLPGSAREFLKQTLVLAVAEGARDSVKGLRDLAKPAVTSVGIGRPTLTSGKLAHAALRKLGILRVVEPKARTSPLRSLVVGDVSAAVIYGQCCYEEDLFVGVEVPRRGIAAAHRLPRELCEPFPVVAVALRTKVANPAAGAFIRVLGEKRAQDILLRRGEWSCPICEMGR